MVAFDKTRLRKAFDQPTGSLNDFIQAALGLCDAQLAKPRAQEPRPEQESQDVGDVDDQNRPARFVGHAGGAGEGPCAESGHESAGADEPPRPIAAAAEVVVGIPVLAAEKEADRTS